MLRSTSSCSTIRGATSQCNCGSTGEETIRRQIPPGRYFAVVQAHEFGFGTVHPVPRVAADHARGRDVRRRRLRAGHAGTAMQHRCAHVTPAVGGPVTIEVDSFDPVEHWQFYRDFHVVAVGGVAQIPFVAPHVGRWRAAVSFDGTRTRQPGNERLLAGARRRATSAVARNRRSATTASKSALIPYRRLPRHPRCSGRCRTRGQAPSGRGP